MKKLERDDFLRFMDGVIDRGGNIPDHFDQTEIVHEFFNSHPVELEVLVTLLNRAFIMFGPKTAAVSCWHMAFQMGREYEHWLEEMKELEKIQ